MASSQQHLFVQQATQVAGSGWIQIAFMDWAGAANSGASS